MGKVKPAVNQCKMDVSGHDDETISYCRAQGITYEAYNAAKGCATGSSVLQSIARAHSKSVYQVCFRYILDRGCGSDPKVGLVPWIKAGGTGVDTAYDYGKDVSGGTQADV